MDRKIFFVSLTLIAIYVFPLLTSNIYYYDDLSRVMFGYSGWVGDARPVGDILYRILSFGNLIPDLFPFPLIISIIALCLTFSIIWQTFNTNENIIIYAVCFTPLVFNPLFISNLHFRYDAPFMVLSICFALLPFAITVQNTFIQIICGSLFIVLSFSSYQTAINVFIIFCSLEALRNIINYSYHFCCKKIVIRMASLFLGYLIYAKMVIPSIHLNNYFAKLNKTLTLDHAFPGKVYDHYIASMSIFVDDNSNGFKLFFFALISIFVVTIIFIFVKLLKHNDKKRAILFITTAIIALTVSLFCIIGLVVFSENPVYYPRVYLGLGAFITTMIFPVCWIKNNHNRIIVYAAIAIPFTYMFSFGFAANNAIRLEDEHIKTISILIVKDILSSGNINDDIELTVNGKLKLSAQAKIASTAFPLIKFLLPKVFDNKYDGGQFMLRRMGLPRISYDNIAEKNMSQKNYLRKSENYYYQIWLVNEKKIFLTFL